MFKPIKYGTGEGRAKIKIEDESGATEGNWTIMMSDLPKWFKVISHKYGHIFKEEKKDEDLDWLR
jgi:hypothetical protein